MQHLLFVLILITQHLGIHPFHVSVCEIDYIEAKKSLQITQKIFIDDLEKGIHENYNNTIDITLDQHKEELSNMLRDYYSKNLKIQINGKSFQARYLGFEFEDDALWCYLEIQKVRKIKSLQITNTILFDTFDDQSTILHVQKEDDIKSFRLTNDERSASLVF